MTTPRETALRRSVRRFRLGSGPLKRGSDRVQAMGRLVVVLSFLVAPTVGVATANATTARLERMADAQAADRSRTDAVLLEDALAPTSPAPGYESARTTAVPARATWTVPGGGSREGTARVPAGTRAGTAVHVWVDREGSLTGPPLDRREIPDSAAAMGALPLVGVPLLTWTLYAVLSSVLDGHRDRRWAQDWATVEPKWNSHLG
jgi:hypothetical protein